MSTKKGNGTLTLANYFPTIARSNSAAKRNSSSVSGGTPAAKKKDVPGRMSPEQLDKMESNKLEASAKLWTKRLNAGTIGPSWMKILYNEFKQNYFEELASFVEKERSKETVYPPPNDVFTWTTACTLEEVKVVIIGQDPYHGPNQAHGLCFSVKPGVPPPPSLKNMYRELEEDISGFKAPGHGCLIGWARQGVLLLNACLTVRAHQANSHQGKGWEKVTDAVIKWLNDNTQNLVFILWGAYAQKKGSFIDKKKHSVLKGVHPSPLSAHRGFFGCKHFSQTNHLLGQCGRKGIDWGHLPTNL